MRIAIVDDISEDRLILRSEINAYFQEKSGDTIITFEEFPSGEALLSAFVPGHFQIVFLDIYMPGTNGMDAARRIYASDPTCRLVFFFFFVLGLYCKINEFIRDRDVECKK